MPSIAQWIIMSTMLLTSIGFGVILPTLPFLTETLGATAFELGLAMSMFSMSQIFASSIWGSLSDRIGRKPVLIMGIVGYGVVSSLLPFSPNVAVLLVIRFLGGVMSSAIMPSSMALVADTTTTFDRPRILGYMGSINGIGFIFGPLVGSALSVFGIHAPFVCVGILSILNGLLAMRLLPGETKRKRHDAIDDTNERMDHPSLILRLKRSLTNKMVAPLLFGSFILALVDSSISVTLAFLITGPLQSTQAMVGWAFMINACFSAIAQTTAFSRVFHRLGDILTIVFGFVFSTIGYFMLGSSSYLLLAFCGLALLSIGRGFAYPAVSSGISLRSPKELQGSSFGTQSTISSLARTIGPLVAGWLFLHYEQSSYFFSAVLLLLTVGFYLLRLRWMPKPAAGAGEADTERETLKY